jgi:hypothetical protein
MISISEDKDTYGIGKVTVFADTYTEMMQVYKTVDQWHYNVNIYKDALRFGPNHLGRKQWTSFYTYTTRK